MLAAAAIKIKALNTALSKPFVATVEKLGWPGGSETVREGRRDGARPRSAAVAGNAGWSCMGCGWNSGWC